VHLLEAHRVLAGALLHLGELTASRAHAEQGIALYDPQQHHGLSFHSGDNAGVACHFIAALVQWLLGYPDQALQRSQEALRLVQTVAHPFSRAFALIRGATLHQYLREAPAAQGLAGELIELARTQGFTQRLLIGVILQGWALTEQGQAREGMAHMRQGLAAFQATGAQWSLSYYLALLAEAHGKAGETAEGVRLLAEAWAAVESQDERYWEAELHRLQGDLRLRQVGSPVQTAEAEVCWQRSLAIARHQQARSLELRAAMSLARLWQQQGKRAAARELLAPVYGWFTEGFDTADLQEAKALLEALA
jgi:predicted ATPase